jgi:predicted RNA-binding Zn-ribbon protein involved in translation (DUF1610 family)
MLWFLIGLVAALNMLLLWFVHINKKLVRTINELVEMLEKVQSDHDAETARAMSALESLLTWANNYIIHVRNTCKAHFTYCSTCTLGMHSEVSYALKEGCPACGSPQLWPCERPADWPYPPDDDSA